VKVIDFVKVIHIQAETPAVYAHIADIANHPFLQPLVVETQEIGTRFDDKGHIFCPRYAHAKFESTP